MQGGGSVCYIPNIINVHNSCTVIHRLSPTRWNTQSQFLKEIIFNLKLRNPHPPQVTITQKFFGRTRFVNCHRIRYIFMECVIKEPL